MSIKNKFDLNLLRRLFRFLRPYKYIFGVSSLLMVLLSIVAPIRPLLIIEMVNRHIVGEGANPKLDWIDNILSNWQLTQSIESYLFSWTILLLVLLFFEAVIQFGSTYLAAYLGQSIIRDVRLKLFKHFNSFKLKYFDQTPIGTIVTRMISDIEAIAEVFSIGLITMFGDILKLIVVIGVMFSISWKLTLVSLIPIPLLIIATRIFARAMKKSFQKERVQLTRLNTFVQEHITGMNIVQLFNRQKKEYSKFVEINKGHRQAHIDAVWANSIFFPVVELLSSLSIAVLILWGMLQLNYSDSEAKEVFGIIIGFILYIHMLYRPIRQLADKFNVLQRGMVRAERVFEILDRQDHIDNLGKVDQVNFNSTISFENVKFAYKDDNWVLKGLSFSVEQGKSMAIVGTTGAGKSTVINLLTRFYEFQEGEIKIDNISIREIELSTLRKNIAIVLQDVFLFSDSIMNNITLGDKSISREEVIEAAKKVGAHDFIMELPLNYDYNVRERGGVLSTGQRQLISFIRAFVFNPKILILDEATSNIDSESEDLIQKAIKNLQKGRTSIVIAHRLSTIVNSDEILVMEEGKIIERGRHGELLSKNGRYKKLYDLNFSG